MNTLITGAGGPAAIGFFQAQATNDHLYMADMDVYAAGLYLVPEARRLLLPAGADPSFVQVLLQQCLRLGIQRVVPTVDAELLPLARARHAFENAGIQLILSPLEALEVCVDKRSLHEHLHTVVPCPATVVAGEAKPEGPGPWIVKPRIGSGSRGIRVVHRHELDSVPTDGGWLIQELLPGMEYSVDVLVGLDGAPLAAVPRERLKVDSGVAVAARTVKDPVLEGLALKAAIAAGIRGVANVQFKLDRFGAPRLMEINPRFPGTMAITVAAGANLPQLVVDLADGKHVEPPTWSEVAIVRTLATHVVSVDFDRSGRAVA